MKTLTEHLQNEINRAQEALEAAKKNQDLFELHARAVDEIVTNFLSTAVGVKISSGSIYCSSWQTFATLYLYGSVKSFSALIPLLEHLEQAFSSEFVSSDDSSGVRTFYLRSKALDTEIYLRITPLEDNDSTCQRVLIGEDTHTETVRTPKYRIQCN